MTVTGEVNMQKKIRVAAVGLGWVTTHRHIPAMLANSKYELVAVVDRKPGRAKAFANRLKLKHFCQGDSLEIIPWLDDVDAITIGTSPQAHYPFIRSALKLGKHVLTEKPFAATVAEGEELVRLAADKKKILAIVHNFQFASSTRKLLRDIQSGKLGKIRSVIVTQLSNPNRRLPAWYKELPMGLFYDESPHFFYLLSRLAPGPLKLLDCQIYSNPEGLRTPAAVNAHYFAQTAAGENIPVMLHLNFEATISEWHVTVYGEKSLGDIDIFRDIYICLPNDGLHSMGTVARTSLLATWQHWAQYFISGLQHIFGTLRFGNDIVFDQFAEAVFNSKPPQGMSAEDALKVLKMQHEILQCHEH